jgi:hypothetical protein
MLRSTFVAVFLIAASLGFAVHGQETGGSGSAAPGPGSAAPQQPLNKDHLAPTGVTMPRPGVPQASGPTELDRSIQQQDDRTDNSICKGC